MTIRRLLVANRGEIARRVFRTCRTLGIETVAVFSDADADLPFVREADMTVRLPGSTPGETYLRGDLIVEAARNAGADAIHPGYGFLSENAGFARQVIDAGLTWVGPPAESIEAMGSKVEAKKLVAEVDVPVLQELSPSEVTTADLPLLVKASAGGGGRGMRIVRSLDEVADQVELAANEAASAFGDATVFCEPYIERGRHIEVQVLVDQHGSTCLLGERDCSIQRRHQKVVEETPAPDLSDHTRRQMLEAARLVAASAHYIGAGTVEFLYDPATERFWFLEMNTRLQVEHPVTELVNGIDLVALQIAVAEGRHIEEIVPSTASGALPAPRGHAVEVRLYAEDPAAGWQPQSGRLARFDVPEVAATFDNPTSWGIRLDSGFESGSDVGTHYDAMLAKVIAWAPTREEALRRLAGALRRARIHGVRTNRDLLVEVLGHPAFVDGDVSTHFLEEHDLAALGKPHHGWGTVIPVEVSAHAAALALAEQTAARRRVQRRVPVAWRNVPSQPQRVEFVEGHRTGSTALAEDELVHEVAWYAGRDGYRFAFEDEPALDATRIRASRATCDRVVLDVNGIETAFEVTVRGDLVDVDSVHGHVALTRLPRFVDPADQVATGSLLAPMPGAVVSIAVAAGEHVAAGRPVLVLEAMKMQHTVFAPHDGVVTDLPVTVGDQVAAGAVLAVVQELTAPPAEAESEGDNDD
ncbi:MAG TPA: biotin carboxylase N-terminal domain-containing protein [Nocardioidaceae bacterium]|nr:biotin carboxylase N-terminal domain-containing protein [Nocardioidaceae bacterium]